MNFSAIIAAPDSSMREKPFIAREEKLTGLREICNRSDREQPMFFVELNTSQVIEFSRAFFRKCMPTTLPLPSRPDRGEPVGAGWLMNKDHFVAEGRMIEGNFANEVKSREGSCHFTFKDEEKARVDGGLAGWTEACA